MMKTTADRQRASPRSPSPPALALTGCGRDSGGGGQDRPSPSATARRTVTSPSGRWAPRARSSRPSPRTSDGEPGRQGQGDRHAVGRPRTTRSPRDRRRQTPDVSLDRHHLDGRVRQDRRARPDARPTWSTRTTSSTGAWGTTVVGGTSYGVPWYVETRVLYYRTDLAEKAGWDKPPQTWDELKKFAEPTARTRAARSTASTCSPAGPARGRACCRSPGQTAARSPTRRHEFTLDTPGDDRGARLLQVVLRRGLSPTRMLAAGRARAAASSRAPTARSSPARGTSGPRRGRRR